MAELYAVAVHPREQRETTPNATRTTEADLELSAPINPSSTPRTPGQGLEMVYAVTFRRQAPTEEDTPTEADATEDRQLRDSIPHGRFRHRLRTQGQRPKWSHTAEAVCMGATGRDTRKREEQIV